MNHGCKLAHRQCHDKGTRAGVPVVPDFVAFAMHGACNLSGTFWQRWRYRLAARTRIFDHLHSNPSYAVFPSWTVLTANFISGVPSPQGH